MLPKRLEKGDTIGLISPSDPVVSESDLEYLNKSILLMESSGFKVKLAKNALKNTTGYGATAKEKAEDILDMFKDSEIKAIFCIKGGLNSSETYEYLDFSLIKNNPKILCGFSDSTSLLNVIYEKTGLVTYHGPTFKSLTSWDTEYAYRQVMKSLVAADTKLGEDDDEYQVISKGKAQGILVGGNLSLISRFSAGAYSIDFTDKILFIEELVDETPPALASSYLYYMKQNGVFDKIKGIWIGNYSAEVSLSKILKNCIGNLNIPIIHSENFGHIDKKIVIPIGVKAEIDTDKKDLITIDEMVK